MSAMSRTPSRRSAAAAARRARSSPSGRYAGSAAPATSRARARSRRRQRRPRAHRAERSRVAARAPARGTEPGGRDVGDRAAGLASPEACASVRRAVSRGERGRHRRPPPRSSRAARSSATAEPPRSTMASWQASTASSSRWVETRTAAPRARASVITSRVASTPSGSTPSNGSSSSSTSGWWKAASTTDIRRPMPWLKPEVTRCAAPPRSNRSSRSRARSSQPARAGAAGPRAGGAPRASRGESGRRRRGSSRSRRLTASGLGADVVAGRRGPRPRSGGMTPASTRMVVDLPAPLRPTRAVEPPPWTRHVDVANRLDGTKAHLESRDVDGGESHDPTVCVRRQASRPPDRCNCVRSVTASNPNG